MRLNRYRWALALLLLLFPCFAAGQNGYFISPLVPLEARKTIEKTIAEGIPGLIPAAEESGADIRIGMSVEEGPGSLGSWHFVLALPFCADAEGIDRESLKGFLSGGKLPSPLAGDSVWVDEAQAGLVGILFRGQARLAPAKAGELLERCRSSPGTAAIVGFEALEPRWKALSVSGVSLLERSADLSSYPLVLFIDAAGKADAVADLRARLAGKIGNRDPRLLRSVAMTGVTAMTRVTAKRMEQRGITYPGLKIAALLRSADLSHVSNEVSFVEGCEIKTSSDTMLFCSKPSYIGLLEYLGIDVVELTGNHLLDFGKAPFLSSLDLYAKKGMRYFGGGRDAEDAGKGLTFELGGSRIVFFGACAGPSPAYAGPGRPGPLLFDQAALEAKIRDARDRGLLPIVCIQYFEEYDYAPTAAQQKCFRALIEAGAAIVQGSQAHQPQSFEFYEGGFIHYGLGNFIFDQMWSAGTRESLIDFHYFYGGRHLGTAVRAALIEDYAQPRPMTEAERRELLAKVYASSLMDGKAFR
jgi:hypothetical protein